MFSDFCEFVSNLSESIFNSLDPSCVDFISFFWVSRMVAIKDALFSVLLANCDAFLVRRIVLCLFNFLHNKLDTVIAEEVLRITIKVA